MLQARSVTQQEIKRKVYGSHELKISRRKANSNTALTHANCCTNNIQSPQIPSTIWATYYTARNSEHLKHPQDALGLSWGCPSVCAISMSGESTGSWTLVLSMPVSETGGAYWVLSQTYYYFLFLLLMILCLCWAHDWLLYSMDYLRCGTLEPLLVYIWFIQVAVTWLHLLLYDWTTSSLTYWLVLPHHWA
jgi:hypothetical protein